MYAFILLRAERKGKEFFAESLSATENCSAAGSILAADGKPFPANFVRQLTNFAGEGIIDLEKRQNVRAYGDFGMRRIWRLLWKK